MTDLTKGNVTKLIFYFTLPMLIGNIFQQLYTIVDSVVVGRVLGENSLAAIGASFPIIYLLISLIMGLTMGSTIIIAQYYGARDMDNVKKAIDTAYIFLFVGSIIITIVGLCFSGPLLILLKTPSTILHQAKIFLNIYLLGLIFLFGYNSVSSILRGLGDSKTPLYFLIISTVINAILVILFVVIFKWGISGSAWATVIAQASSFGFSIYYLNKNHAVLKFHFKGMKFDKKIFLLSIKIGLPTGVQQMLFSVGMMALQSIVNSFGTDTVAAYTAATRIDSFCTLPMMNFGAAISTFVGQNLGAGRYDRSSHGLKVTLLWSSIISIVLAVFIIFFRSQLISLFNPGAPKVIRIGGSYLSIVGTFYIVASLMVVFGGAVRGAGDTLIPMIISILSLWLIRLPLASLLSRRIGSNGIWWSISCAWTMGFILTALYYISGRWKSKVVTKNTAA